MESKKDIEFIKAHIIYGGLYKELDINDFTPFNFLAFFFDEWIIHRVKNNLNNNITIDTIQALNVFCPTCKEVTTFESFTFEEYSSEIYEFIDLCKQISLTESTQFVTQEQMRNVTENALNQLRNLSTITRNFICVHSKSEPVHHFFSVSYLINNNKIIKVGQYPSINDITGLELRKYKKINNDVYLELNKANGLFSHGVGIGSYTYLRRIIEKYIVNEKYNNYLISIGKTVEESESLTKNTYFKDKVTTLKYQLSDLLHGNEKIYGFLSKGIHGLSEDECLEVFPILFESICIILDEEIERIEKEAKKKELASKLNKLK